ncbi:MAG: hypothetical protein ACXVEF_19960 [Polyangiales bacterium]
MLEPIIGLVVCVLMYLGVWLFAKVSSEFKPDLEFERWCAGKPMIMAFRTRSDHYDARFELRQLLEPHGELVNLHGGVPWQYYRYDVVVRPIADDVVAIFIERAILQRGRWTHRRDAAELVREIIQKPRTEIVEVWMHGQLHPSEARSQLRDQRSWFARVHEGVLDLHPMIGRPPWAEFEA